MPGVAVFPHPGKDTVPLALRANTDHNQVLHESVIIVTVVSANVPHVPAAERLTADDLGRADDGIQHLSIRLGFSDQPDLPAALQQACDESVLENAVHDISDASYFVSRGAIRRSRAPACAAGARRSSSAWPTTPPTPPPTSASPGARPSRWAATSTCDPGADWCVIRSDDVAGWIETAVPSSRGWPLPSPTAG
ncbi:hypothetical protein GCM10025868_13380 [Angustibacter aerolatus]|uniref:K+ potassium transporter C-terminal domain-containing protein n=1 Tax=Angustibacter aerolatus TaxID=1162965 RepID=A0ABQ6JF84_9ACTN|nr:hypothetical protein GCM10025868_13380 [Angustibacter aerolatus]